MGVFRSLAGLAVIRITSADLLGLFSVLGENDIQLLSVEKIDELTCQTVIYRKDLWLLKKTAQHRGDQVNILKKKGIYWNFKNLLRRPVLMIGGIIFLLVTMYLPSRVLFIEIEGNEAVPEKRILEAAKSNGISFFASRRDIRSEKVKNALLEQIPQLQWVGVNTAGCVATIRVTEKSLVDEFKGTDTGVGNIVALRDGVIWEYTVTKGDPVCRVGQAVKAGQILISGYTDCGIAIKAVRPEGEIYAQTLRDIEVVTPAHTTERGDEIATKTKFSLLIGKKLINLFQDSGISDTECVKMYETYYLTLPGGFQLPVGFIRQTRIYYSDRTDDCIQTEDLSWINCSAEQYLNSKMIAGRILNRDVSIQHEVGFYSLKGTYACLEMIGQFKAEEFLQR